MSDHSTTREASLTEPTDKMSEPVDLSRPPCPALSQVFPFGYLINPV